MQKKYKRILMLAATACILGSQMSGGATAWAASSLPPTPLISRDVPAYASDGQAQAANGANYRTFWR